MMCQSPTVTYENCIRIRLLSQYAEAPTNLSGSGLFSFYSPETTILKGGRQVRIPLDIQFEIPENIILHLYIRDSLARNSIILMNPPICPLFKGNLTLILFNTSNRPYRILAQDKIATGSFQKISTPQILLSHKIHLPHADENEDEHQDHGNQTVQDCTVEGDTQGDSPSL